MAPLSAPVSVPVPVSVSVPVPTPELYYPPPMLGAKRVRTEITFPVPFRDVKTYEPTLLAFFEEFEKKGIIQMMEVVMIDPGMFINTVANLYKCTIRNNTFRKNDQDVMMIAIEGKNVYLKSLFMPPKQAAALMCS